MSRIEIRIIEEEDFAQYQSIGAFLIIKDKEFLLDSVALDTEDFEADADLIDSFIVEFTRLAENNMSLDINVDVNDLETELRFEASRYDEE